MRDNDDGLLATAAASKLLSTYKSSLQHNKAKCLLFNNKQPSKTQHEGT